MGTLGCIHDMMRRDKENRELRQRDRERMKETRRRMTECRHTEIPPTLSVEKLEKIKKQTQEKEQADQSRAFRIKLIIGHTCPSAVMRILALKLRTRVFQICLTQKFFQAFSRSVKQLPLPISLSTVNVPPCASTKSREMESPSPLPCTLVPGTRK